MTRPREEEALRSAADSAGAAGLIAAVPAGHETPLGKLFAGGTKLSQGEWQKVALARGGGYARLFRAPARHYA
jgi:ATP-binding cassette subfamily B protein